MHAKPDDLEQILANIENHQRQRRPSRRCTPKGANLIFENDQLFNELIYDPSRQKRPAINR
jgi:hypothetical protein